jgi:hypothetical protein
MTSIITKAQLHAILYGLAVGVFQAAVVTGLVWMMVREGAPVLVDWACSQ